MIATFEALTGNIYLLKVTSVGTTPTVTQGVVTYPVQAMIMRTADIQKDATALADVAPWRRWVQRVCGLACRGSVLWCAGVAQAVARVLCGRTSCQGKEYGVRVGECAAPALGS